MTATDPTDPVGDEHGPDRGAGLTRNIYVVSAVSLFQDAASEMLYPVLPFFLTVDARRRARGGRGHRRPRRRHRRGHEGRSPVGAPTCGHRRPLIAAGYGISSFGKVLVAVATAWPMVAGRPRDRPGRQRCAGRAPGRASSPMRPHPATGAGRSGSIAPPTPPARSSARCSALAALPPARRTAPTAAVARGHPRRRSATLLVFLIHEHDPSQTPGARRRLAPSAPAAPRSGVCSAFLAVFSMVNFPDALLLLRADELGLGFAGVILVYVLYNLTYAALSYPAGAVSDRLDRRLVFGLGLVVFAVTYLGFGLTDHPAWCGSCFPLYGAYTALTDGVSRAWVADLAPPELRGTALGAQGCSPASASSSPASGPASAWAGTGHLPFLISGHRGRHARRAPAQPPRPSHRFRSHRLRGGRLRGKASENRACPGRVPARKRHEILGCRDDRHVDVRQNGTGLWVSRGSHPGMGTQWPGPAQRR